MNMEKPLRKWEGVSLGWKNLSSRNPHMWKSMMMRRKMKNGMKRTKWKYERNKQFEKLTAETMAIREKMEKMQLAFRKAQRMDDYLYNMGGVSSKAPIPLPPKFKISDVEKAPPPYQNWLQVDEIEWNCSKLIEITNVNINAVEAQGIWDEEDEVLKEAIAIWGTLPKGVTKLKKRVLEDNVANITRSGKYNKPSFLEKDHPGRDLGKGFKPAEPRGKKR
ncbi:hypothetical protein SO802_009753 [Lithocarpus litseifolius]|uniref:Uncharacterized protein n=1 Tax=Lithocarpus litseifolius TaxID=425828 RepID=A0AAW2DGM5_9ROSI